MDLSVIIVNWNTKKLLEDCLSSIYKYTKTRSFVELNSTQDDGGEGEGINFEVIVVDNGSEDGSPEMVKKKFPRVLLIPNKDNLGFAKANNQGIKIAKGEYILLLNSDTYLIENSLEKLVKKARSLQNRGSTPPGVEPQKGKLGALGPQLLNEDRTVQQSAGFFPHLPQIFWWMSFLDDLPGGVILKPYHVDHDSFYKKEQTLDWVTAAAVLVPKNVIAKSGPLDDKIFMYGEDFEWCYRIKKASYQIYFSPAAKIVHIGRGSSNKIPTRAFVGEYKGIIYFYQKHKGKISLQIVRLLLKIGALLRIVVFGLLGRKELVSSYVQCYKVA